jgi:hypothetical protein
MSSRLETFRVAPAADLNLQKQTENHANVQRVQLKSRENLASSGTYVREPACRRRDEGGSNAARAEKRGRLHGRQEVRSCHFLWSALGRPDA